MDTTFIRVMGHYRLVASGVSAALSHVKCLAASQPRGARFIMIWILSYSLVCAEEGIPSVMVGFPESGYLSTRVFLICSFGKASHGS